MHGSVIAKRALLRAAFTCGALLLAGAPALAQQGPGVTDKEIKLGTWIPLTGPLAAYGVLGVGLVLLAMYAIAAGRSTTNPIHGAAYEEAALLTASAHPQAK